MDETLTTIARTNHRHLRVSELFIDGMSLEDIFLVHLRLLRRIRLAFHMREQPQTVARHERDEVIGGAQADEERDLGQRERGGAHREAAQGVLNLRAL